MVYGNKHERGGFIMIKICPNCYSELQVVLECKQYYYCCMCKEYFKEVEDEK